ncbi:MAG TPA: hypothetical protein VFY40_22775 [Blastocatellia bacterium]|nr:hypothetical protein [Blastocatellia bacterium]
MAYQVPLLGNHINHAGFFFAFLFSLADWPKAQGLNPLRRFGRSKFTTVGIGVARPPRIIIMELHSAHNNSQTLLGEDEALVKSSFTEARAVAAQLGLELRLPQLQPRAYPPDTPGLSGAIGLGAAHI